MRRYLALLLGALLLLGAVGCSGTNGGEKVQIAMILSETGNFEANVFFQGAWEGLSRYGEEKGLTCGYYEPESRYEGDYFATIEKAVKGGAEVIVFPGYLLEAAVYKTQDEYPDVKMILLDGEPNNAQEGEAFHARVGENTYAVLYAEEQAGFLAGYAAVKDGFRKLGFFGGMRVPAVQRFGHGYIQGAEYAAKQLELPPDSIEIRYTYCGSFAASPEFQSKASTWYLQGTEVIFACGGAVGYSVMQAASSAGAWVIGVDNDQSAESETVITSAMKMIPGSVYDAVKSCYEGDFPGGRSIHLGIDVGGVGLAMDTARFRSFSQADYNAIYQALATDREGITSAITREEVDAADIPASCVRVQMESMK